MSDPYREQRPGGGPIPAAALNAAIRGGLAALRARGGIRSPGQVAEYATPATEAFVKWTGEDTLPVRSVVTYDGVQIDPGDFPLRVARTPVFTAGTPADSGDAFAVLLEPCLANGLARAVTMGVAVVDVDVTDENHTHANATPDETGYLTSAESGRAEILYKPDGETGVLTCVVMIGGGGGGGGCEGSVCTDYYTATENSSLTRDYHLSPFQTAVVWETLTTPPTGVPVVVHGGILAGPMIVSSTMPGTAVVYGRLVVIDSANAISEITKWMPLGHYARLIATNALTITEVVFDQSGEINFWDQRPQPRAARQGTAAARMTFDDGERVAWEIMSLYTGGIQPPCRVYNIGGGPTYIIVMTGCGSCDPEEPTVPGAVPPAPPVATNPLAPVASFNHDPQIGIPPLAVGFVDTSTGAPTSWSWDFDNGNTSNRQNPNNVYPDTGTYTVTLTVSNAYGSSTATGIVVVTKEDPALRARAGEVNEDEQPTGPLAGKLYAEPAEGVAPFYVLFRASLSGGSPPYRVLIDFGDGVGAEGEAASHEYTTSIPVVATMTATDSAGSVLVDTVSIAASAPASSGDGSLTAGIGYGAPFAGPPYEAFFTDNSSTSGDPILNWAWDFGDGGTSTLQNPVSHTYAAAGTYTVRLTVSHATDTDTEELIITIP